MTQANPGSIKSAERVLDILERLADSEPRRASLAELGRQLGIPKSSLHGLLRVLVARGYVDADAHSRSYYLGPRVLGMASSYLAGLDLHQAAKPVMVALARLTDETITLDVPHGASTITIAREAGRQSVWIITRVGLPFASHATASGKALLAGLSGAALAALYPERSLPTYTSSTIATLAQLREELAEVRRTGVAYAHGELSEAIEAVAVPIIGHDGQVVAALDVVLPLQRAQPERLQRIEGLVRAGARIISARIGGPPTEAGRTVDVDGFLERIWHANGKEES